MGRAIDMEKDIDVLKRDVAQLKTAFEGLASTVESLSQTAPSRKNVDLHEELDTRNVVAEGTEVKPDEEFTPPAGKRKKTKTTKPKKVESML